MMEYEITTQKELRKAFWQGYKTLNNTDIIELYNEVTGKPLTQNEYNPYPIGFGFGLTQVSFSSILSATIGFGRGDPLSAAKLHIKFSSRL